MNGQRIEPWIETMARVGYASKAAVYTIIGFIAAQAALGSRSDAADSGEAFRFLSRQPFGKPLMLVVAAGLLGYAVWRVLSAFTDSERRGDDAKGLAIRAGSFFRGLFYGLLALEAFRFVLRKSGGGGGSDSEAQHWTARVMDMPFGRFLVIAGGLGIAGYGFYQLYRAWKAKLGKQLRLEGMQPATRRFLVALSRFGMAARGIIFALIGYSVARAAIKRDPDQAQGTEGAIEALGSFGAPVLAIIALGLIAYGIYQLVNARYRIIDAT